MTVSARRVVARFLRADTEPTQEMKDWFDKRTSEHIERVQKYCQKIEKYDPKKFKGLVEQGKDHDQSKLKKPEIDPYIWITWQYKCQDDGKKFDAPDGIEDKMNEATQHHVKNNRHHPEFHCSKKVDLINRDDRDKPPSEMVDATKMLDLDIAEMCADWLAMSEEKKSSPKDWADKNVNVRWKFTNGQKDLIYKLISDIGVDR